jgi:hypothetical protein
MKNKLKRAVEQVTSGASHFAFVYERNDLLSHERNFPQHCVRSKQVESARPKYKTGPRMLLIALCLFSPTPTPSHPALSARVQMQMESASCRHLSEIRKWGWSRLSLRRSARGWFVHVYCQREETKPQEEEKNEHTRVDMEEQPRCT